jgi:hypothetical protein
MERRRHDRRRPTGRSARAWQYEILFFLALGAIVYGAIWYFTVYDTAQGRCQRGDLGACAVVVANQVH